jgi:hypothetical protein
MQSSTTYSKTIVWAVALVTAFVIMSLIIMEWILYVYQEQYFLSSSHDGRFHDGWMMRRPFVLTAPATDYRQAELNALQVQWAMMTVQLRKEMETLAKEMKTELGAILEASFEEKHARDKHRTGFRVCLVAGG